MRLEKAITMPEVEKVLMFKSMLESDEMRQYAAMFARYALEKPSENDPALAGPDGQPGGGGGPTGVGSQGGVSMPMLGAGPGGMPGMGAPTGRPALPPGLPGL